jgi:hypothetical protein
MMKEMKEKEMNENDTKKGAGGKNGGVEAE